MTGSVLRGCFLLLLTLGCFADKAEWTFTFLPSINVVKHSDVEIPCTFTAPADYGDVPIVWYKYNKLSYPIVYSEDQPKVIQDYRGRTSLIRNGNNSCSLRIRDVRYTARYYPGISDTINAFDLNTEEEKKTVQVKVSGCSEFSCKDWGFTFPRSIEVVKGSCVEIPCRLTFPNDTQSFTLFWYKNVPIGYPKIFDSRTPSDVGDKYTGRTFQLRDSMDTCSLRINNVQEAVEIYPGVNEDINSYHLSYEKFCRVSVIDSPPAPLLMVSNKYKENEAVTISCSVDHTCASSPPSITWNKPDVQVIRNHEDLERGIWRITSTFTFTPSYRDDKTLLQCTVTFPNMKISRHSVTLDITYEPKNVTISVLQAIEEEDNMRLRCSSQANPAVTTYTWYKVGKTKTIMGSGELITVQNGTSEKYICSAGNEIGTTDSPEFSFVNQNPSKIDKRRNISIIGGTAGLVALIIIILVITFCILKRRKQTQALAEDKGTEEDAKIEEQIMMENIVYENMDDVAKSNSPRSRSSHNELNDNIDGRNKGRKSEDSVMYTSVELLPANSISLPSRQTEETEYAELNI